MKTILRTATLALTIICLSIAASAAGNIMPSFSTLPTGWFTDRYDPASFSNVGLFHGHADTLGIGIDSSTGFAARPPAYQDTFYNTQGRGYTFSPNAGPGSVLSADLYIPASWGDATNGNRRTDMWGVMVDSTSNISAYPIIGFTNYGGAPRLRIWDDDLNAWVNLATPVAYDVWTNFAIRLNADSTIDYFVNGAPVFTDYATGNSAAFSEVIMQAYNFEDPAIAGAVLTPYTAYWSNPVPVATSAAQCKNNGWKTLFRTNGTGFKNQGDCVSYTQNGR